MYTDCRVDRVVQQTVVAPTAGRVIFARKFQGMKDLRLILSVENRRGKLQQYSVKLYKYGS